MKKEYIYHVISNTHWDREWRYPYQKNRQHLVKMIDSVLDILQNHPDYKAFHLDSQTIVLRDYLEIRPQKEELLKELITAKRLFVGPWYILPDEFLIGGENLIRNLLLGHKIAEEFGHVMKVGYSPFSWGQISQLPQIYAGFDIPVIMFYRGINSLDSPKAEFVWEGADGTKALCSRFSTMPRYNFYFYIYRPVTRNEKPVDVEHPWSAEDKAFHLASPALIDEDYSLLNVPQRYHIENLKPAVEAIIKDQLHDFTTRHIFWAEGHDTSGPSPITPKIIADINQILENGKAIHSNLEEYANALVNECRCEELALVKGERRSSQYDQRSGNLYGYTTSARMYLKQANFHAEKWLQYYAEPLNTIAGVLGLDTTDTSIDLAWELLLQNSAHDSIGGCSLDAIHDDMLNRYKQCNEISRAIIDRACQFISQHIRLRHDLNLVVFNPMAFPRNEIIEAYIDIPVALDKGHLSIVRDDTPLPVVLLDKHAAEPVIEQLTDRPMYYDMMRYHVLIDVNNLPAFGYSALQIKPVPGISQKSDQTNNNTSLENEFLHVSVNSDGSLDITDKQTRKTYRGLGYFYDEGESGHAWVHRSTSPIITTQNKPAQIRSLEKNALRQIIRIRHEIQLPINLTERRQKAPETSVLPINVDVILTKRSRCVQFKIEIENRVESHRLRMMFPTNLHADYSYGEGQFDVVKRPLARPNTSDWVEQPMYDYPLHLFADVSNDDYGLAVLVDGLKEYEVLDDRAQTLAITLLRSFEYRIPVASMQDFSHQKGSQCLGKQQYQLALYPHQGDWQRGQVFKKALEFNYQSLAIQAGAGPGSLPDHLSFLTLTPDDLVFSALKMSEDSSGVVLRVYNPGAQSITGTIESALKMNKCILTDLAEKSVSKQPIVNSHRIQFKIAPKAIRTFRLFFDASRQ